MQPKTKIIVCVIWTLVALAFGRFLAPEKVKIEKQIVEVEKKSSTKDIDSERNKRKETTTTEKTNPDGSKETTTHTIETTETAKKKSESDSVESTRAESETKEIERGTSKVTVSALAGASFTSPQLVYGASVSKPILGPITVGIWGLTTGTAGASLGLTF